MKYINAKSAFLCISIVISSIGFLSSQNIEPTCGTTFSEEQIEFFNSIKPEHSKILGKSLEYGKNINFNNKSYIPIKAHIIRQSDGTKGLNISSLNEAINDLNDTFLGTNLEFFICGDINFINQDNSAIVRKGNESNLFESNNVADVINIYFSPSIINEYDQEICGYSNNARTKDYIIIKNSCAINASSLAHEMGHFFSLLHTHGPNNNALTTELVDGSNCDTDGDGICDTPADPKLSLSNVYSSCEYFGTETDANGHPFNPDTGNIMSYARKSCRTHFSEQQIARMYAFYLTQKHYLSCPSFNADIVVDHTNTCESTLEVNFTNNNPEVTKWEWDIDSDGIVDYTNQNPTHNYNSGIYDVTLTVYKNSQKISKVYPKLINVGVQTEALFDENFNTFKTAGDSGWSVNDVNNSSFYWLLNHGETASEGTGPLIDNHNDDGSLNKYIYVEASGANQGDVAEYISPCINVAYANSEMQFSYHMFGENIGELHVDIKTIDGYITDVITPLIGNQQEESSDPFFTKSIDLSSYAGETINIAFRAVRGNGWKGDIAIDDIFLKTISTSISDDIIKLYPNPVKGNLLYIKTKDIESNSAHYEIANLVGQKFKSGVVSNRPIDTNNLASGSYILTVIYKEHRIVKRFIK